MAQQLIIALSQKQVRNFLLTGFFLTCLLLIFCQPLFAQDPNYFINDVVASGSGSSPNQARTNAIASAQRNAFLILLGRLGVKENIASTLEDGAISDMVASQQIMNEKIAGNNYSATLNLSFSESFVKHYLGNKISTANSLANSLANPSPNNQETSQENIASSYLVIPIKIEKPQPLIWETNNDWKLACESFTKNNNINYLKLPKGDIDDISAITIDTVNNNNFTDFEPLITKYKVDGLILAYFDFDSIENKVNITLQNIQKFNSVQTKLAFVNVNQLSPENLINKVAEKTINYIALSNGKKESAKQEISSYQFDVLIFGLNDWLKIKNKLENSNLISQLKINSISKDLVKINVSYNSVNGDIINFFAKNNLFLQKKNEGGYILSLNKF
jgi:hypothetical protein